MTTSTARALNVGGKALVAGEAPGCAIVAVATDDSGNSVVAAPMGGVGHVDTKVARKKPLTACTCRTASYDFGYRIQSDALAEGVILVDSSLNPLPGRYYLPDRVIGEFAVSAGA